MCYIHKREYHWRVNKEIMKFAGNWVKLKKKELEWDKLERQTPYVSSHK